MVSLSTPVRRMWLMASSAVISGVRATNSVVITDPAESSLYFRISLICLRVSASAWVSMRRTMFAGISSIRSTASSMYISSMTAFSSVSEKLRISVSFTSLSISTKVSAARSLGSSRKMAGISFSGMSLRIAAISAGYSVCIRSRRDAYFFSSASLRKVSSRISVLSFKVTPPIIV